MQLESIACHRLMTSLVYLGLVLARAEGPTIKDAQDSKNCAYACLHWENPRSGNLRESTKRQYHNNLNVKNKFLFPFVTAIYFRKSTNPNSIVTGGLKAKAIIMESLYFALVITMRLPTAPSKCLKRCRIGRQADFTITSTIYEKPAVNHNNQMARIGGGKL